MPHYASGREVKLFDEVFGHCSGRQFTGVVVGIQRGATTCNLQVAHTKRRTIQEHDPKTGEWVTISHFPEQEILGVVTASDCEFIA